LSRIDNYINKVKKIKFLKNVLVLLSGTALGQMVLLIASPLLTRLYTPSEFGTLGVYVSILTLLGVLVTLRYELAIPIDRNDKLALNLTVLSIIICIILSLFVMVIVLLFRNEIAFLLNTPNLSAYLLFLPLSLIGLGLYKILNHWALRYHLFNVIAKTRVTQSLNQVITQLTVGFITNGPFGLIIGDSIGRMSGATRFLKSAYTNEKDKIKSISLKKFKSVARKYKKFPLISTPSAFFNTAGLQLPQVFLVMIFGAQIGGMYILLNRVVGLPMQMLGQAVSQVFLSESSKLIHQDKRKLKTLIIKITIRLFLIGAIPMLILVLIGPDLFEYAFGSEWRVAGEYIKYLSVMFLAQFVVSPVSQTLNILQYQGWQFTWDFLRCLLVIVTFVFSNIYNFSIEHSLFLYSCIMSFSYILLLVISYYSVCHSEGVVKHELKE
jgi:O-antigen/teichoic acid export membrane protein